MSDVFEASTPRCAFPTKFDFQCHFINLSDKKCYPSFSLSPIPKIDCSNTRAFGRRLRLLLTRNCPSKIRGTPKSGITNPTDSRRGGSKSHVNSPSVTFSVRSLTSRNQLPLGPPPTHRYLNERGCESGGRFVRWTAVTEDPSETDRPTVTDACAVFGGSSQREEKCGGLVRSLRYVAMMDGRRTSARVARERGRERE